jgi:hypothetical protein
MENHLCVSLLRDEGCEADSGKAVKRSELSERRSLMDCWPEIQALEGKTLRTLDRRKPFEIVMVAEKQVVLKVSTGKVRTVRRSEIEDAFCELTLRGTLSRSGIHERHSPYNPAYVAAILAELEGVTYRLRPIRLFYGVE